MQHRSPAVLDAVLKGDKALLKSLIRQQVDVDVFDADGRTPLIHAAIDGNFEGLCLLLGAEADPNSTDQTGNTESGKRTTHWSITTDGGELQDITTAQENLLKTASCLGHYSASSSNGFQTDQAQLIRRTADRQERLRVSKASRVGH